MLRGAPRTERARGNGRARRGRCDIMEGFVLHARAGGASFSLLLCVIKHVCAREGKYFPTTDGTAFSLGIIFPRCYYIGFALHAKSRFFGAGEFVCVTEGLVILRKLFRRDILRLSHNGVE